MKCDESQAEKGKVKAKPIIDLIDGAWELIHKKNDTAGYAPCGTNAVRREIYTGMYHDAL